jgi:hypothetical protein
MCEWRKLALNAMLVLNMGAAAQAGVLFSPNGSGPTIDIGTFDWGLTSFLARGGNQAVTNAIGSNGGCPNNSCDFTVYTQARLIGTLDQAGGANTPTDLNRNFEITMIMGFNESVTDVTQSAGRGLISFDVLPDSVNFLQIFYDDSPDSNPLTGYGFNDGTLILSGNGLEGTEGQIPSSSFSVVPDSEVPIDRNQSGDQYPGQQTVIANGGADSFAVGDVVVDSRFFTNELVVFGIQMANISSTLPFVSVDPMDCFTPNPSGAAVGDTVSPSGCSNTHTDGPFSANPDSGGHVPVTGRINGALNGSGGPDFIAQTDFNSPVASSIIPPPPPFPIPEPDDLALLGLGLGLLGCYGIRRRT